MVINNINKNLGGCSVLNMTSGLKGCRSWKDILMKKKTKMLRHRQRNLEQNLPHHSLHCETEEEQPKAIRTQTLIYLVTVQ